MIECIVNVVRKMKCNKEEREREKKRGNGQNAEAEEEATKKKEERKVDAPVWGRERQTNMQMTCKLCPIMLDYHINLTEEITDVNATRHTVSIVLR